MNRFDEQTLQELQQHGDKIITGLNNAKDRHLKVRTKIHYRSLDDTQGYCIYFAKGWEIEKIEFEIIEEE